MTTQTGGHYSLVHIDKEMSFTSWPAQDNTANKRFRASSKGNLTTVSPLLVTYNLTVEAESLMMSYD